MEHLKECAGCKAEVAHTTVASCGNCGLKKAICRSCWPTFVTCSERCKAAWREMIARWNEEKMVEYGKKERKPKGDAVHQQKLFGAAEGTPLAPPGA